ncbi:hypothetical protein H6F87_23760 [Cyanobacteria bacterium FACHB-502]|nr:hypothetical protein [Cyanobacteria bacterium FACHB-502]
MQCLLQPKSGRAVARFGCEEGYWFGGGKSVIEGIHSTVAGWNPDKITSSGRCRTVLTPT